MRVPPLVTLLTDFGGRDPFVGVMKGVILGICRDAVLVDLCHEVPPQDILAGSFLLETARHAFPPGTTHVAVVDPGVGGPRRPIVAEVGGQRFIAPDNGLLSYPLASTEPRWIRHLTEQAYWRHPVSASFHGRDVFAPVAGHLAAGVDPARLGPCIGDPVRLEIPRARMIGDAALQGTILWVDRFGNCITNVARHDVEAFAFAVGRDLAVRVEGHPPARLVACFSAIPAGDMGAIVGSSGHVELFCNQGSLAREWGIGPGQTVRLERAAAPRTAV